VKYLDKSEKQYKSVRTGIGGFNVAQGATRAL